MKILNDEASVVVSTYTIDRLDCVLNCIESLKKQTLPPKEIILVLDPDKTLVEFYESRMPKDIKIVIGEGFGLSNARNVGARNADGDIIVFIDDDATANEDWLKNLVKNYDSPYVVGVGGLIKPVWESNRPAWFPEELDWVFGCSYKGLPKRKTFVRNLIGANMSFRKDVFKKVGYFKVGIGRIGNKLLAGEEAELSIRILEKIPKSKIVYDPSSVVYHTVHKNRTNLKFLLKVSFYQGLSKALIANASSNPSKALSVEDNYLRYLLKVAIPSRLKRFHQLESIYQLLTLLLSICSVLIGYFIGLSSNK